MTYCPILCPLCRTSISPHPNYKYYFFCEAGCDSQLHFNADWNFVSFAWRAYGIWIFIAALDNNAFRLILGTQQIEDNEYKTDFQDFNLWDLTKVNQMVKTFLVFQ